MNRATRPSRPGLTGSASKSLLLSAAAGGVVLKAAPDTTTSTSLTWNEPEYKPDNYRVERSLDGTTFSTVTTLANTVFDYTDTGRTESTQYWYRIVPILGGADQLASNVADTWTVPATPTSLTATAVSSSVINLAWTDVSTGNTGYVIEARRPPTTGTYGVIGTAGATATTFSATLLQASTAYEFRVAATNPATQSAYSNAATATTQSATVPNAPTGVSASASTTAVAVTITWTDASTDEDNFNVYRNTSNTTVGATLLNSPLAGIQTYTDNATNNPSAPPAIGTTYYYWVSASNGAGESAKTAASQNATGGVTTLNVPAAPTSLTTTGVSTTQIDLAWTDNATNETSYIVERRSPAGTGSYSQITSLAAGSTTFSNTGLSESVQYEYRVAAVNAAGNSAYSNASSKFTIPATPTGLTATATSSTQINLAWTDVSTGNTGQRIERRSPAGTGSYSTLTTVSATATTYSDTGLNPSTQYEYRIIATNADYDSSPSTAASATTNAAAGSTLEYLVVAGGGGGARGGGGAGGYRTATGFSLTVGTSYTVTVGAGGAGGAATGGSVRGATGSNSVFSTITSDGGGGGGGGDSSTRNGANGGSGGGGGHDSTAAGTGGTATSGQGNAGGSVNGSFLGTPFSMAGGGGSSAAGGANTSNSQAGSGGAGTASSISGSSVTRGGGGGGGVFSVGGTGGSGGSGGGGAGGVHTTNGTSGSVNTGSGGGGSGNGGTGGSGGSGVVILRMASSTYSGLQTGSPTVSTSGSDTILTYNASGTYTGGDSSTYYAEYLVVAGGGGGCRGGGGAGGYKTATGFSLTAGTTYTVTVGGGGANASPTGTTVGTNGSDSVFSTVTSTGGGGGGRDGNGSNGGSGGGGGANGSGSTNGGAGTSGQGNAGGNQVHQGNPYPSGGGGGASAAGQATQSNNLSGNGGDGSTFYGTVYAGGGGGGNFSGGTTASSGGSGGGGAGALGGATAGNGTTNRGGGGGGSGSGGTAGNGGSGVVIIRVPAARYSGTTTGSPTVTDDGQFKVLTFNASGSYTA